MTCTVINLAAYRKAEPLPEPKQPRKRGRKPKADAPVAPPQTPASIYAAYCAACDTPAPTMVWLRDNPDRRRRLSQ